MKFTVNGIDKKYKLKVVNGTISIYDEKEELFIVGVTEDGKIVRHGLIEDNIAYNVNKDTRVKLDKDAF